jgi:hypothetical protein
MVQCCSTVYRRTRTDLTKLKHLVKHRTIPMLFKDPCITRSRIAQLIDVVRGVESDHLRLARPMRPKYMHVLIQLVIHYELMRHLHALRLHRMALPIVVVTYAIIIKIRYAICHFWINYISAILGVLVLWVFLRPALSPRIEQCDECSPVLDGLKAGACTPTAPRSRAAISPVSSRGVFHHLYLSVC